MPFDPGARGILPGAAAASGRRALRIHRDQFQRVAELRAETFFGGGQRHVGRQPRPSGRSIHGGYYPGLSGRAGLAAGLAVVSQDFAGVIACGAAFDPKHLPRDGRPALLRGLSDWKT